MTKSKFLIIVLNRDISSYICYTTFLSLRCHLSYSTWQNLQIWSEWSELETFGLSKHTQFGIPFVNIELPWEVSMHTSICITFSNISPLRFLFSFKLPLPSLTLLIYNSQTLHSIGFLSFFFYITMTKLMIQHTYASLTITSHINI